MKILVLGANGKVGKLVVSELLNKYHEVVAFVHNHNNFTESDNLKIYKGDIQNKQDIEESLNGVDCVISTLASWGTPTKDILTSAIRALIPALSNSSTKRIISLTGSDATFASDDQDILHKMMHSFINIAPPARKILFDGEEHMRLLSESDLDWTILRSPIMNNRGDAISYELTNNRPKPWNTINRQMVALAMVDQLEQSDFIKKAPYVTRQ